MSRFIQQKRGVWAVSVGINELQNQKQSAKNLARFLRLERVEEMTFKLWLEIGYTNYKNEHGVRRIAKPRIRFTRRPDYYGPSWQWFLFANVKDRNNEERAFLLKRISSVSIHVHF